MTAPAGTAEAPPVRVMSRRGVLPALQLALLVIVLAVVFAWMGPAQFVNALTLGAIYALIAIGYTMVYGIIELINFAHGDVFMVATFVSLSFLTTLGFNAAITDPALLVVVLVVLFAFTMIVMGFVGVIIERVAYRPLRNAPRLAPLITAIGVSFILQNIVQGVPPYFGYGPFNTNSPQIFPTDAFVKIGNTSIPVLSLFIVSVALGLMVALQFFVGRTRIGRSMRSTAADREAASLMGVNINRTIAITFFIGSALAGAAGVTYGLQYGNTRYDVGFQAGLIAFTAAVLGGIGNTVGAALGGFIIGFIVVGAAVAGYNSWGSALVFGTLIIVLVFRPSGILGQQTGERA
ncbi:MAG: branched-chain amino acid ABC transporter permease [Candidatus Limnocylindrales bacterium]